LSSSRNGVHRDAIEVMSVQHLVRLIITGTDRSAAQAGTRRPRRGLLLR
jgi:hypothetical protein